MAPRSPGIESPPDDTPRWRLPLRWLGWVVVALLLGGYIALHRGEWREIGAAAIEANTAVLVLAALFQVGWLVLFGATFWTALRAVELRLPPGRTLIVSLAANFINMVVKSGGMSGMAFFLRAARLRNLSGSRATLGYLLTIAAGYVGFLSILALALVLLWLDGSLRRFELIASVAVFVVILVALVGLLVTVQSPRSVRRTYAAVATIANRAARLVRRGPPLAAGGGGRVADEIDQVMRLMRGRPARLTPLALTTLGKEAFAIAVMFATLRAFDPSAPFALALTAYALAILFSYISIVPSGIGIVEVSLTALLVRAGLSPAVAALATITYRLFAFWTPFLIGALATRFVGSRGSGAGSRG